jgi:hypothetical protein
MFFVDGESAAKTVAKRELINRIGQGTFYLAAAAVAGTHYYSNLSNGNSIYGYDDSHRFLLGSGGLCSNIMGLLGDFASLHIRNLAEDPDYDTKVSAENGYGGNFTTNIPLWLCLGGYLYNLAHFMVMVIFCFPGGGKHKAISVPMNIDCEFVRVCVAI